jgi:hypothetical protein
MGGYQIGQAVKSPKWRSCVKSVEEDFELMAVVRGLFAFCLCFCMSISAATADSVDSSIEDRFLGMALDCVEREYPNKISHVLNSAEDVQTPRSLHPAFYGCFDWHSAVHGHWLLVRLLKDLPEGELADRATAALDANLTPENIAGELAYFSQEGRSSFERPYGLAWLFQLGSELREWDDPRAARWGAALAPLEQVAADRFTAWLPNLVYPIRIGTHNQSAFGFALALDWARTSGNEDFERLLVRKILDFHQTDRDCPIGYEPSGQDFLSPCLMEADLMRRVMSRQDYAEWLYRFLPDIPRRNLGDWLEPGQVLDETDGKLVHLDGVNLSRAWNLVAIAHALPTNDRRRPSLLAAAALHTRVGTEAVTGDDYAGGHWLASFATYLVTNRALEAPEYRPIPTQ